MSPLGLGLSLVAVAFSAVCTLVQIAQLRALRREARAMAEALARLASPQSLHTSTTARRRSEARRLEARRTTIRVPEVPSTEAERSVAMIQALRALRPDDENPDSARERPSGFWPTHPGPSQHA
jgi:hypothetical protein